MLRWILGILGAIVGVVVALVVVVLLIDVLGGARLVTVSSSSMETTLHCAEPGRGCKASTADHVFVCRLCYSFGSPQRGDIVLFNPPPAAVKACRSSGSMLLRLIGVSGDTVYEAPDGTIQINGVPQTESYVSTAARLKDVKLNPSHKKHTWDVLTGEYFLMGDNRATACDSRTWGGVPRSDMLGKVAATYWPLSRFSLG
jgi:signal peptidase I